MAFNDALDLRVAVVEEVGDPAFVDRWSRIVSLAEAKLNRKLRTRQQIANAFITVASGNGTLPTDYQAPLAMFDASGREVIQRPYQIAGQPTICGEWAVNGSQIVAQDGNYTLQYYAKLPSLADDLGASNWLLLEYPGVYLWACTAEAFKAMRDGEGATAAATILANELADLAQDDGLARYGAAKVRVQGATP